jgi:hypothetical protein
MFLTSNVDINICKLPSSLDNRRYFVKSFHSACTPIHLIFTMFKAPRKAMKGTERPEIYRRTLDPYRKGPLRVGDILYKLYK